MLALLLRGANKQGKQALEASKANKQEIEGKIKGLLALFLLRFKKVRDRKVR
jgi:hypothetical protein